MAASTFRVDLTPSRHMQVDDSHVDIPSKIDFASLMRPWRPERH